MAKAKSEASLTGTLMSFGFYKRNHGRITRQLTSFAIAGIILLGAWTMSQTMIAQGYKRQLAVGLPAVLAALGTWFAFRVVQWPRFGDFLISVEAEMDKVTWASRAELQRATAVVIVTMVFIGVVLLAYDIFWAWLFTAIGVLKQAF